jgi:hypothetical protein
MLTKRQRHHRITYTITAKTMSEPWGDQAISVAKLGFVTWRLFYARRGTHVLTVLHSGSLRATVQRVFEGEV